MSFERSSDLFARPLSARKAQALQVFASFVAAATFEALNGGPTKEHQMSPSLGRLKIRRSVRVQAIRSSIGRKLCYS